jgi:hypothetical protein
LSLRAKIISLWVTALLSPLVAGYALLSAITFVWFNATGTWSDARASLWAWSAFFFFCLFAVIAIMAIVRLVCHYNSLSHLPDQEDVTSQ